MRQLGPCAGSVSAPGGWNGRGCSARRSQWKSSAARGAEEGGGCWGTSPRAASSGAFFATCTWACPGYVGQAQSGSIAASARRHRGARGRVIGGELHEPGSGAYRGDGSLNVVRLHAGWCGHAGGSIPTWRPRRSGAVTGPLWRAGRAPRVAPVRRALLDQRGAVLRRLREPPRLPPARGGRRRGDARIQAARSQRRPGARRRLQPLLHQLVPDRPQARRELFARVRGRGPRSLVVDARRPARRAHDAAQRHHRPRVGVSVPPLRRAAGHLQAVASRAAAARRPLATVWALGRRDRSHFAHGRGGVAPERKGNAHLVRRLSGARRTRARLEADGEASSSSSGRRRRRHR